LWLFAAGFVSQFLAKNGNDQPAGQPAGRTVGTFVQHGKLAALAPPYLVIFIGFCGYSLMITLFVPMLMGDNGFLDADASPGERSLVLGLLLAVYPLGQFLGSPVIGALSDRYGRKPVLLVSLAVTVAAYFAISFGIEWRSLALLAAGCLLGGLAESNIAIAQSAISDETTPEERPRLFAWTYSASSLGYIVGPVAGGQIVLAWGWSAPFWLVVPLLLLCLGWTWLSFGETHAPEKNKSFDAKAALTNLVTVFTDRPIRRLYLVNFLIYLGLFGYFRMVLVYMVDRWDTTVDQTTLIYSGLAVISAAASFGALAPLSKKFGLHRLAVASAIAAGLAMSSVIFPPDLGSIWITGGLTTFLGTLALASCPTLLSNAVSAERQGRVMGNNLALQVGAESASAALGGALAGLFIPLPLVAFGILLIGAGLLLAATRLPSAAPAAGEVPA
jgi:DHA1 family tetracycline resistance protein-like MFS transporter